MLTVLECALGKANQAHLLALGADHVPGVAVEYVASQERNGRDVIDRGGVARFELLDCNLESGSALSPNDLGLRRIELVQSEAPEPGVGAPVELED